MEGKGGIKGLCVFQQTESEVTILENYFKTFTNNCQHDGEVRTHRRNDQEERITLKKYKKGLVKTGAFCPARMIAKVALDNDQTEITYIKSHNHPVNISNTVFQPIPKFFKS